MHILMEKKDWKSSMRERTNSTKKKKIKRQQQDKVIYGKEHGNENKQEQECRTEFGLKKGEKTKI